MTPPESITVLLDEAHRMLDSLSESNRHLDNKASFILTLAGVAIGAAFQIEAKNCLIAVFQILAVLGATATGIAALIALTVRRFQTAPDLKGLEKYHEKDVIETRKNLYSSLRLAVEQNEEHVLPGKRNALKWSFHFAFATLILFGVLGILKAGNYQEHKFMGTEPSKDSKEESPKPPPQDSKTVKPSNPLPIDPELKKEYWNSIPKEDKKKGDTPKE